ncbi:MAG: flavodoxin family protein [Lachnospiraceae bacterium]|nr:flavodoxin family protein [Lachnospiraceae bacterium]
MDKKKVVVLSTSLRGNSNSEKLAEQFAEGARNAGNEVELISLRSKNIRFCIGCLVCQSTGSCVIKDDAIEITEKVLNADVVVFATPIYYYEMSGQMKTLIDRMNSMYAKDYHFRDIYFLASAAEEEEYVPERAIAGLQGWIDCYGKTELKGTVFCGGVNAPGDIEGNVKLKAAYEMGAAVNES